MPTHVERRHLPYTVQQLFDLVADIEKYPEFIDEFEAARIRRREGNVLYVDQVVRFAMLRAELASIAVLDPPREIVVTATDPRFERFENRWRFSPAPEGGSIVEYSTSVDLRPGALKHIMEVLFDERRMAESTILAFKRRARQIYGARGLGTQEPG